MIVVQATELEAAYRELVELVLTQGERRPSRLGTTLDVGPVVMSLAPGQIKLLSNSGRAVNPALAIVEACWILSGGSSVQPLASLAPSFFSFSDDGSSLSGAYGERLRSRFGFDQIDAVIEHLRADPDSRRAFALIAEPQDSRSGGRDVPCNIALMFRVNGGRVDMTVVNRSNDVIFGVPYDVFSLSLVHFAVCRSLRWPMGTHIHIANSMHMYEANEDLATRSLSAPPSVEVPAGMDADAFLDTLVRQAEAIGCIDLGRLNDARLHDLLAWSLSDRSARGNLAEDSSDDWLKAMANHWNRRGRTSAVAKVLRGPAGA